MKKISLDDYILEDSYHVNIQKDKLEYKGTGIDLTNFLSNMREYILKQPEKMIVTIERTKEEGHYFTAIYISKQDFGGDKNGRFI